MPKPVAVTRPPGRVNFLSRLELFLDPNELERSSFAYQCSKYGHAKQIRDDGTRFFDHPKSVAWIYVDELGGQDPDAIIAYLLHDMQEDSFLLSSYRIRLNFGVATATRVQALTKRKKGEESEDEYLDRVIREGALAVLGKALDRLHNCRTLLACPPEKRRKQIDETRNLVMPKLLQALRSHGSTFVMYADYIEKETEKALSIAEASLVV